MQDNRSIRETLPRDLTSWRSLDIQEECQYVWETVRPTFHDAGIYVWPFDGLHARADTRKPIQSNGFAYVTSMRGEEWTKPLQIFTCHNELTRGGSTLNGLHVVIRVVAMGDEGKRHLAILRKLAQGPRSMFAENHVVPLWQEVEFEDITFTVAPFVAYNLRECYGFWAKNSVGDIVDMILQALEAIAFVHALGIVHRDLCKANYVIQWHPESLVTMRVPLSRPRALLTDFETAHEFPSDLPPEQRLLSGLPLVGYVRPVPPEMTCGKSYDPFKADIWQLAESFSDFRATIPEIDNILEQMLETNVSLRLSAVDARDKLAAVVHSIPPNALLIPPFLSKPSVFET